MFAIAGFSTAAMAEDNGDVAGHVLRSRDSQPIAEVPVQIKETGAKATTNAQGAYTFSHLPPGAYTLTVSPSGDGVIQRKISVTAGKTTQQDITVGADEMSALESITVLAQRTSIAVAREAQYEAPNLVNITTFEEIRKLPDVSVARSGGAAFPAFRSRPTRARGATSIAAASMPT